MKLATSNLGLLLLAIWLILYGALPLLTITAVPAIVMQILAIVAGILILIGR